MPRCFLAKKSSTFDTATMKWDSNAEPDENENCSSPATTTRDIHHRSTIGSISAAQAVRNIQEPIGMPPQATTGNPAVTPGRTLKESSTNQTISLPVSTTNNNNQITSKLNSINLTTTTTNLQQLSKAQSEEVASTTTTTTKFIPCEVTSSNCNEKTDLILPTKSEFPNSLEEDEGLALPLSRETDKSSKKCPLKVSKLQERRRRQQQQQQLQQQQQQPESVNANNNLSTLTMASGEKRCCPVDVQQQQQQQHSINHSSKLPSFQNGHVHVLPQQVVQPLQLLITQPPLKKIKLEPNFSSLSPLPTTTPLPPEILANIKPHPPTSFSPPSSTSSPSPPLLLPVKPLPPSIGQQQTLHPVLPTVPVPITSASLRIHTKEETEAAHDLLELSRSLPPISGSGKRNHVTIAPPTPPSPPEDQHYTLIYITSPTPFQNDAGSYGSTTSSSHFNNTEYPLTPPEQSTDSNMYMGSSYMGSPGMQPTPPQTLSDCDDEDSQMDIAASDLTLSIVDGRTKKSKHGGIQFFGKDCKSKYTCSECGKNYATSSNLSRHKQTHRSLDSGSAKKCNICGKMYVSMPALSMHILTHNLNHRCHVCGKAFSRPWLLQGHLRSHTGQKPYLCTVCKKCFADRSNLRAHMQTHSPAKNFQCTKCKKTFALKSYLNKHYESACVRGADSPTPNSQDSFSILS